MVENRLQNCIRRMLRSCKSKDQLSDVVPTHDRLHFTPQPHPLFSPATEETTTAKLPLLSPVVNGRKCPPASPIISSPLNDFPKHKKKASKKKKKKAHFTYKKCALEDRFPDHKYVNGLFLSSDDEDDDVEEEETSSFSSSRRRTAAAVGDSLAVVKRSRDPYNDFRASMVEMIVEKNIFAAKDLENLLRCFLSLNSHHHHKVIIQVFAEIWEAFFSCNHHI